MTANQSLLQVKHLTAGFHTNQGLVQAIEDVSFDLEKGEVVCIVGESGSGKSVTSLSIMRLIEHENGQIIDGEVLFEGENLLTKSKRDIRNITGKSISMIFQEPMTALNPVFTIGKQIAETIRLHSKSSKKEAMAEAVSLLKMVGIAEPEIRAKQFPHELSGGMRQRVMIAIAIACSPKLLIADEPTTALDVTIQAQILQLLMELKEKLETSIILITHDIGVAAQISDRIVVMYAGKVVEEGTVFEILEKPLHPYTIGLLESIPAPDGAPKKRLKSIKGSIPDLTNKPTGCRFHPRCEYVTKQCINHDPKLLTIDRRKVACWLHQDDDLVGEEG